MTPIFENGRLTGYQSVRVNLEPQLKREAEAAYKALNQGKTIEPWYSKIGNRHLLFALLNLITLGATFAVSTWFALLLPF